MMATSTVNGIERGERAGVEHQLCRDHFTYSSPMHPARCSVGRHTINAKTELTAVRAERRIRLIAVAKIPSTKHVNLASPSLPSLPTALHNPQPPRVSRTEAKKELFHTSWIFL